MMDAYEYILDYYDFKKKLRRFLNRDKSPIQDKIEILQQEIDRLKKLQVFE